MRQLFLTPNVRNQIFNHPLVNFYTLQIFKNINLEELENKSKITLKTPENISRYIIDNKIYIEKEESESEEETYLNDIEIDSNDENHPKNDYPSTPEDSSDYNEGDDYWREDESESEEEVDFSGMENGSQLKKLYQKLERGDRRKKQVQDDYGYRDTAFDFWYGGDE